MGVSLDSKQRTEARAEANAAKLDTIRLYTLTELEPILGVTHRTLQSYIKDGRLKGALTHHLTGGISATPETGLKHVYCLEITISGH